MAATRPLITITTDFGYADGTIGAMIGVIKSICPESEVVINAAEAPPHDIPRGAWALYQAVPFFPLNTIHVAVVDPGVGTTRRPVLMTANRGHLIGPDNGVLSWALRTTGESLAYTLENPAYRLSTIDVTFDGRDLFAAAAAHLARGADPRTFGPMIRDPQMLDWPEPQVLSHSISGVVLLADHFGNLITNIPYETVAAVFSDQSLTVQLSGHATVPLVGSYDEITGSLGAVINGSGLLEIAGKRQSAAAITGLQRGATVQIKAGEKAT